jgi:hypothetical protein
MKTFSDVDKAYRDAVEAIGGHSLAIAFKSACSVGKVDFKRTDLTRAVLLRLKSYYTTQKDIKEFLGKRYVASAADFFVETITFYLKVAVHLKKLSLCVASEKTVTSHRGAMRPDISLWKGEKLIAAIECKTQLGWNRDGWRKDFLKREKQLKKQQPNAKLFLLIMTGSNWGGFGSDARIGKQFFVLLENRWPQDVDLISTEIVGLKHSIEGLFREIFLHADRMARRT